MTSKEAIEYLRNNTKFYEPVNREAFRTIEEDLNILQAIRNTYKVFKDDDEYFLSDGKHLHIIDKKQFDKWNGWLNNEI